ncbi:fluoroquinolone export ABC transporter permease subunit [Bacillus xiapuensis]|uniref:fluoroquinolone export ABC transporter permease subunit n=1 Tax=Bacillus xiapuensis TaxID=2014075 RepID=UPI000C231B2E|nr:ABC transporter permease [Bacillus xiapuensis]
MRLASAIYYDLKLQYRHGLHAVYFLISHIYILFLSQLPAANRDTAHVLLTFSDPSMLGFFFIGGLVLLEKGQHIHDPLFVTPYKPEEYIFSKTLSLMLLSVASSMYIHLVTFGLSKQLGLFTASVLLTSIIFTLLGLTVAVHCQTVNQFFLYSFLCSAVFCLPLLSFLKLWDSDWLIWLPTHATLLLLQAAFHPIAVREALYSLGLLLIWAAFSFWLARLAVYHSFLRDTRKGEKP